jgi:hypothetical protein
VAHLAGEQGAQRLHILALVPQGRGRLHGQPRFSSRFLQAADCLRREPQPFELLLSSRVRAALGSKEPTPRDQLRAAFLDSRGFLYRGEGSRSEKYRSRSRLSEEVGVGALLEELRRDGPTLS